MSVPITLLKHASCVDPVQHGDKSKQCAFLAENLYRRRSDRIVMLSLLVLFSTVMSCLTVTKHSGSENPPLYGDFEAQRHWMEMTVHLPISQWYSYDLDYWGLDYPVLTAYHSLMLGKISQHLNSSWVSLDTSRGLDQPEHKLFMRLSVIITMLALYAPALMILCYSGSGDNSNSSSVSKDPYRSHLNVAQALLSPALLFVDCSHFQYNHCSLGLFLWAIIALNSGRLCLGSAIFVLALNHKQMELYHALPIAVFLLARSMKKRQNFMATFRESFLSLAKLALSVFVTFAVLWAPFLIRGSAVTLQMLKRLFPIDRGLFEDKVANFWCSASLFIKFKELFSTSQLLTYGTVLVLLTSTPALVCLFLRPSKRNLLIALCSCALSFFMFSFQVHEKSILLVTTPALFLIDDKTIGNSIGLLLSIASFSLYPLCIKDGVPEILPFFIFFHLFTVWMASERAPINEQKFGTETFFDIFGWISFGTLLLICFCEICVSPPKRYPHLFPMLNALYCFGAFSIIWLWLNLEMVVSNGMFWLLQELQEKGGKVEKRKGVEGKKQK